MKRSKPGQKELNIKLTENEIEAILCASSMWQVNVACDHDEMDVIRKQLLKIEKILIKELRKLGSDYF